MQPTTTDQPRSRRSGRPVAARLLVLASAALLLVLGLPSAASAHEIDQSYIFLDVYEDDLEGRVEFTTADINEILGTEITEVSPGPEEIDQLKAEINAESDAILAYVQQNFAIGTEGERWTLDWETPLDAIIIDDEANWVVMHYDVVGSFPTLPESVELDYAAFVDEIGNHTGIFHIGNYWEGGVFASEDQLLFFTQSNQSGSYTFGDSSFLRGLGGVVWLGIDHIRIGTDHILFIIALLLPAVLVVSAGRWEPAEDFKSSLWRVLKIATFFTIAHSITLSLAGFGVVELDSKLVESIIAISIALAAIHNFKPVFANREYWLAFAFGLFHGLGFAGLLSGLGLDRSNRVWSLFAFNLGVEIGQVVVILLFFPGLYLLRQTRFYAVAFKVLSALLAIVAMIWAAERVFEIDLKVSALIDPLVEPPVTAAVVLAFTGFAIWRRAHEDRKGTLIPAHEGPILDAPDREPVGV